MRGLNVAGSISLCRGTGENEEYSRADQIPTPKPTVKENMGEKKTGFPCLPGLVRKKGLCTPSGVGSLPPPSQEDT